jgi:hypothetical protein
MPHAAAVGRSDALAPARFRPVDHGPGALHGPHPMEVRWPRVRRPGKASEAAEGLAAALGRSTRSRPKPCDHRGPLTVKCRRTGPRRASARLLWPFGDRTEWGAYRSRCPVVTRPAQAL